MPDQPPPPYQAVTPHGRAAIVRRARAVLAAAKDAAGRAGRPAAQRIAAGTAAAMRAEAQRLVKGRTTPDAWFRASLGQLTARYYAAAMALDGGSIPPPAALDALDAAINQQAGYLARFQAALARGNLSANAALARAASYGRGVWAAAVNTQRAGKRGSGGQERRNLGGAERHCATCPYLAGLGWRPAGSLPDIGDTPCSYGCQCWFSYRGGNSVATPARLLGPADLPSAAGLTPEEERAGLRYAATAALRINAALRGTPGELRDGDMEAVPHLDSAIAKGRLGQHATLYRGVEHMAAPPAVGAIVAEPGFTSTTLKQSVAIKYARTDTARPGVVYRILAPAGTNALAVAPLAPGSVAAARKELILGRDRRIRVTRVRTIAPSWEHLAGYHLVDAVLLPP